MSHHEIEKKIAMSYQETKGTWLRIRQDTPGASAPTGRPGSLGGAGTPGAAALQREGRGITYTPCVWKGSREKKAGTRHVLKPRARC